MIAGKLQKHRGTGKGCADPLSSVSRILGTQERDKKFADAGVSTDLPLLIMMNLDLQGPPMSYADAISKLPKKKSHRRQCASVQCLTKGQTMGQGKSSCASHPSLHHATGVD